MECGTIAEDLAAALSAGSESDLDDLADAA